MKYVKLFRRIANRYTLMLVVLLPTVFLVWTRYLSPTRIAFINFQDFQVSEMIRSKEDAFVTMERFPLESLGEQRLGRFDLLVFFGRGLNFSPEQSEQVRRAQSGGTRVYVLGATSPESDLTDLEGEELQDIRAYLDNGGRANLQAFFQYVRRNIDQKTFLAAVPPKPESVPGEAYFHLGERSYFPDLQAFQTYYRAQGLEKAGSPTVALITSINGPRSADRAHVDALIRGLEAASINVVPIAGFARRLEFLKEVDPDLVLYLPHGRLAPGRADELLDWLREQRIPVLTGLELLETRERWELDQQGMGGGMLTQGIVMPELDGAIEPFVFSAQTPNELGLNTFATIPERIDTLVRRVSHWLALQRKENAEKKLAIVYFKGPGQNAMVAGGLEVAPSLYRLLQQLQSAGYSTGPLPETPEAFEALIQQEGPVLGPYAEGAFDAFLASGNPELIPAQTYLAWCRKLLPASLYTAVEQKYGPAPGSYLSTVKDGEPCIALPRIQLGNIVLLPQMLPGIGEDTGRLVHGTKEAPPHPYLATYLWAREGFGADALLHFGTHGSLEFSPFRQNALSPNDWPDALVGDLPHLYVYVVNNIGEAIIAKRRSYATILSHLTPPFTESDLYGPLARMQETCTAYIESDDVEMRAALAEQLLSDLEETGLYKDLELPWPLDGGLTEDHAERIHTYLFTLGQEKITQGLYALGRPYGETQLSDTVRMMHIDTIADARFTLDRLRNDVDEKLRDDKPAFGARYREPARETINALLAGTALPSAYLDPADLARSESWNRDHPTMTDDALFAGMLAMGAKHGTSTDTPLNDDERTQLESLVIAAAADTERRDFLLSLADDESFERTGSLLQPGGMENARKLARVIPPMRKALATLEKPGMMEILGLAQRPGARDQLLGVLRDPERQRAILVEQEAQRTQTVAALLEENRAKLLFEAAGGPDPKGFAETLDLEGVRRYREALEFYLAHGDLSSEVTAQGGKDAVAVAALMEASKTTISPALDALERREAILDEREGEFADAVRRLREALDGVTASREALRTSPEAELESVLMAMDGKYIPPSSGGDPIINPASLPTGRNLYSIDAERTPSAQAWKLGSRTAEDLIARKKKDTGESPQKVALTLWGGDFIKTQGIELAVAFRLLGVEPVRNARGVVHDVKLIPQEELGRPRVDVVVQTSGQFRDMAASRIFLLNKAVALAAEARDGEVPNPVAEGTLKAEETMKARGLSPAEARAFATARVFGGANGNYGTGIMNLVESSDRWETPEEVGQQYLENMGAIYTESHWGHFQPGIFEGALQNADTLLHPRGSNVDGALSLDHVYEFMGGLNAAIEKATGKEATGYFNDLRNGTNPTLVGAKEAVWTESRTTLLNPKYITALQEGGSSSAEVFAETFRNTFGWDALKSSIIEPEVWDRLNEVYIDDIHQLNMKSYFESKNPFAYQEMTAVMLETVRKGYWNPGKETVARIANLHASLVRDHAPGCSGFVCDNSRLRAFIGQALDPSLKAAYDTAITQVREGAAREDVEGVRLEKQDDTLTRLAEKVMEIKTPLAGVAVAFALAIVMVFAGFRRRDRSR